MNGCVSILEKLSILTDIPVASYKNETCTWSCGNQAGNPLTAEPRLRRKLMEKADSQTIPAIYQDDKLVVFGAIKKKETYYLFGPMSLYKQNKVELHQYYKDYHLEVTEESPLPVFDYTKIFAYMEAAALILTGTSCTDEELVEVNQLNIVRDYAAYETSYDEEFHHHTYREEKKLLKYVQDGDLDGALKQSILLDETLGKLSENELQHWKKSFVVAVTLCTRAAIEGGVTPAEAYQVSDYFMQKSDTCKDISSIIICRNYAIMELTERVIKAKSASRKSSYVEQCLEYIAKNYRTKITVSGIAAEIGLNSSYLSRVFSKEMNMTIQEHIIRVRLEKASNLLRYSDASITEIAAYVNFATPSYFGEAFHKYYGMTPTQYRKENAF